MRALVLLGLLTTAGCGLAGSGLGDDLSDAAETPDATSMIEAASPSQDAGGGRDATPIPVRDGSSGVDVSVTEDGGGSDTGATDSSDGGFVDDSGIAPDVGAADGLLPPGDGANEDASDVSSEDVISDGVSSDGDGGPACSSALPVGWSLVVYGLGTASCPANFTAHDVSGAPTLGATACSCTCAVTQSGTCTQGTLTVNSSAGMAGSCNLQTLSGAVNGPGCTPLAVSVTLTQQLRDEATMLPPQGGACSGALQADSTQVTAPSARYCDVPAASADAVCNGTPPSGFAACIATSGVAACPGTTPFVQAYVVEDGVMLQCSACSACASTTVCSGATLTGFSDTACNNLVGSVPVDGACNHVAVVGGFPQTVTAIEYTASAATTCTAGSSTPVAQLANPRTICCR